MILETKYFGDTEYADSAVIRFPQGLPGFEHLTEFLCLEQPALRPLVYLQSIADPQICFLTLPARAIEPSYEVEVSNDEALLLKLGSRNPTLGEDIACSVIISAGSDQAATANLLAPVVINISERLGLQIIQTHSQYDCAHPLACGSGEEAAC